MSRQYGVVTGIVESVNDPDGEGRIRLRFPEMPGNNQSYWAPVATLMSGGGRGSWFMPEDGDEVLCAFQEGDVNHPFVIGFLWNGRDRPPTTDRHLRTIRSVNGHEISIYDPGISQGDAGFIRLKDAQGNSVELKNGSITIESLGTITITAPNVQINGRPVVPVPSPI
jgi:phage baseplate assembly protein gpV